MVYRSGLDPWRGMERKGKKEWRGCSTPEIAESLVPETATAARGETAVAPPAPNSPAAPGFSASASARFSSSRSRSYRSSRSDTSFFASSSAVTSLPSSVAERNSNTAWLHLSSARRHRIFHLLLHLPIPFYTSVHRIFCWAFHSGHTLKRCFRVCTLYRHHQHLGGGVLRPVEVLSGKIVPGLHLVEP
jgi:hypothetical protein